mmetsp:Transcript_50166/g.92660  ORF Transcript_50166/g.92660 Transcript_50166/m.92660 type:complete len:392 (+) Transcript_50166:33-1208(+)
MKWLPALLGSASLFLLPTLASGLLRGNVTTSLGSDPTGGARLHLLLLVEHGLSFAPFWGAFVQGADPAKWAAYAHCSDGHSCNIDPARAELPGLQLVDTVPSQYCKDVVSPMVQLLKTAVANSASRGDKFAFISDGELPLKPFDDIHRELVGREGSDFCIGPQRFWSKLPSVSTQGGGNPMLVVKHTQWVVLSREHADLLVQRWPTLQSHLWASVPIYGESQKGTDAVDFMFGRVKLCLDEWAPFAAIYGALPGGSRKELPGLSTGSVDLSDTADSLLGQGRCPTLVAWAEDDAVGQHPVMEHVWPFLDCYPRCSTSHPASFTTITDMGLAWLRDSPFLFARKFLPDAVSLEQFQRVVLSPGGAKASLRNIFEEPGPLEPNFHWFAPRRGR